MKLFIASHSQRSAGELRDRLVALGHSITSRWITSDTKFHRGLQAYTDAERTALAVMNEADVRDALDGLVLIAERDGSYVPGGKHVETGFALALGRMVYVIGSRENLFHWHPHVRIFADHDEFIEFVRVTGNSSATPSMP